MAITKRSVAAAGAYYRHPAPIILDGEPWQPSLRFHHRWSLTLGITIGQTFTLSLLLAVADPVTLLALMAFAAFQLAVAIFFDCKSAPKRQLELERIHWLKGLPRTSNGHFYVQRSDWIKYFGEDL